MPRRRGVGTQRSLALAIIVCTVAILSATVATAKFVSWAQARDGTGTFLTAQSSTHLVKTTSNDYARLAITVATSLTTIALAAVPVIGLLLAGSFVILTTLFGLLFGKKPRQPTPSDLFSDIQGKVTTLVRGVVDDVLDGQQDLANSNAIQELQNQLHNYASSVRIGDTEGKISALDSLVTIFQNLRTQPDLFVSESFVQAQPAPYYLLKKAGTNKCFGPRVGKQTGEPTFTGDTKHGGRDTYALWNCTVPRNLEMLKMRVVPEALPSTNRASVDYNHGGMTESGMATAHTPATPFKMLFASDQNTAGQFCPWDRHASKWRYGFMYKFRSDNCSPTAKNNVKWDTGVRFIPDHTGRKLIIAATAPNNDDGITTVACGNGHGVQGNCPGKLDDDQCYFAQNRDHRTAMDAHLFSKTQHMCMTVFDRVPYYPNLPPSRLRKMLLITPLLTQVNLLALVELQAITGKRSTCAEFDVAARSWVGSFSTVKALYKGLPQDGDDMLWLPALEKQMATLLQKPNCMAAAKVLRKVALKRASQFVTAGNPSGQSLAYRRPLHLPSAMGYQQQQQQVAYVAPVPQQQQVAYVEPNPQQQQVAYVAHVPQQQQQQQVYAY